MENYTILKTAFGSDLEPEQIDKMYREYAKECIAKAPGLRTKDFLNYSFYQLYKNKPGKCHLTENYVIICDSYDGPHLARIELAIFLSKIVNSKMLLEFACDNMADGNFGYFVQPGSVDTIVYDKYPGDCIYEEAPQTNE